MADLGILFSGPLGFQFADDSPNSGAAFPTADNMIEDAISGRTFEESGCRLIQNWLGRAPRGRVVDTCLT
jgi:hypothetical protein